MLLNWFVFLLLTVFYYRELGWGGVSQLRTWKEEGKNYFSSSPLVLEAWAQTEWHLPAWPKKCAVDPKQS